MKLLINSLVVISFFSVNALADCDFSKGITALPDGNYEYTKECNLAVGQMKQDLDVKTKQNLDLNSALSLKDLAIQKSDQRANLWMDTSFKLEDNITKYDSLRSKNEWLYFGLGFIAASVAMYAVARTIPR
jgi:hypothetical protein